MQGGTSRDRTRIRICGIPIFSGARLLPDASIWGELHEVSDYVGFARGLRGQFGITVETDAGIVAISDFGGSRPIFYQWDPSRGAFRVSQQLAELKATSSGRLNRAALFSYATRDGVGIDPFYDGVKAVFPATVTLFQGSRVESAAYLDWGGSLEQRPACERTAEDGFIAIASEYLHDVLRGESKIGCLLSGGTDSALMAWLLRSIGKDVVCLTADYDWKSYSEYAAAAEHAAALKLPHERVLIHRRNHRDAFRNLNSELQNAPCCHSQTPSLLELARRASELGINRLVTGDHADALFLGFNRFFNGFPQESEAYARSIAALDAAQKIGHVYGKPSLRKDQQELLSFLDCDPKECAEWQEKLYAADCQEMAGWAEQAPLPTLQQLSGQIWAGVSWQNVFLPVTQAFGGDVEFISPFYDLKMVQFALSLPLENKFRDGTTKVLLRNVLRQAIPQSIAKRASPNPSRIWSLIPDPKARGLQSPRIRPLYDRLYLRNLAQAGRLTHQVEKISALGIWLAAQPIRL